jgi:hypothetical protein
MVVEQDDDDDWLLGARETKVNSFPWDVAAAIWHMPILRQRRSTAHEKTDKNHYCRATFISAFLSDRILQAKPVRRDGRESKGREWERLWDDDPFDERQRLACFQCTMCCGNLDS